MQQAITVPSSVTVRSAHEFVQAILAGFENNEDAVLDVSAVVEADLAFVEILYAAREQWARAGRELRLVAPVTEPVVALLRRAGFLAEPTPQDIDFWFHGDLPQ
ncbi:STAS domain-containing protein [Novosphingobium clariflavum]|uniref:STAS domain-containing protein n=1 Tax=Novosphingobium clariflavum TaxID=2029884 RepID=A0ABV6S7U7_9SPHN|nr:STAS domain-containing protein [Novosphingobium clariflavum]